MRVGKFLAPLLLTGGLVATAQAQTSSLTTTYAGGNGQDGNMFDVVAINDITVTGFDVNCDSAVSQDFEVYGKTGTFVGSETTAGDWTLLATLNGVACNPSGTPTSLGANLSVGIAAGDTYAFYVTEDGTTGGVDYTNGTAVGNVAAQNTDLQILEGVGKGYPFDSTHTPRIWNGTLYYEAGLPEPVTVPAMPLFGLGLLAGLLALVGGRRIRRAA